MSGADMNGIGDGTGDDDPFADPPNPLLVPIPGADPAGEDLRYDPVYDRIQEARREEDATAPQGIWSSKLKKADWAAVRDEAEAALAGRSKDLQLAAWLLEAWVQMRGPSGLARGLRLLTTLCLQYWPSLYPKLDPDDPETRLAPLFWLESKLPARIGQFPLADVEDQVLTWQDYANAQKLEPLARSSPSDYEQAVARGEVTLARFDAAVKATRSDFYEEMQDDLTAAADAVQALRTVLDSLCGPDSPAFSGIDRTLGAVSQFVRLTLAERGIMAPIPAPTPAVPPPAQVAAASRPGGPSTARAAPKAASPAMAPTPAMATEHAPRPDLRSGPITSREQAYRMLAEAADYLALTEPHSPTPYLVRRAVSWGRMSLAALLNELIDDDGSRKPIENLLHLKEIK